jgi:HNH endonuclease
VTGPIPDHLRALVVARASERCEYCGLGQRGQEATFHVDHVVPQAAEGRTTESNLALACVGCSLRKGAREVAIDPESGQSAKLFDPRYQVWTDHFSLAGFVIVGLSPTGRATADAMGMNRPLLVAIREEQAYLGRPQIVERPD